MFQVWKAHEMAFSVWVLEINTLFNNINSLYKTSRKIFLQAALNRRIFELVVVVGKASQVIDSCWIINQQKSTVGFDQSEYRSYTSHKYVVLNTECYDTVISRFGSCTCKSTQ